MVACVSALESTIVGQPVSGYGWRAPFCCEPRNRSPAIAPSIEVLLAKPFIAVSRIEETAVSLALHNTGDPGDNALRNRPGDWRVSIVGSHENDRWPQRVTFLLPPNEYYFL
jgi:hypothetical protein